MTRIVRALLVALLVLPAIPAFAGDEKKNTKKPALREESRIWILRGLQAEFGTLRKQLPRGEDGLPLDHTGTIDNDELQRLVNNNGVAIKPGEVVQITGVQFKKDSIIFEINGGGKKKRKWFQNIEVGMGGGSTRPINQDQSMQMPTGSTIVLGFGGPIPDVTPDEVKKMLEPVLDFTRRSASVMYIETLPKEIQEAIKNHQVVAGMDREMVLAAKGRPERKIRERRKDGLEVEEWLYGAAPSKIMFVVFDGDQVIEVKEFTPGVQETAKKEDIKEPKEKQ